jgi:hypothetical protein
VVGDDLALLTMTGCSNTSDEHLYLPVTLFVKTLKHICLNVKELCVFLHNVILHKLLIKKLHN